MPPLAHRPGLYVHVPFCAVRCPFCSFAITTALEEREAWTGALEREMELRAPEWPEAFDTVYLGGGTPSLLGGAAAARLLDALRARFRIEAVEVTLEANPGDLDAAGFERLLEAGVTRLSLGVQSLDDDDLRFLGRGHDARACRESLRDAWSAGFRNVTVDLIYGLPGRPQRHWTRVLDEAAALAPDHVSAYMLAWEPGTPLTRRREAGEFRAPDEEEARDLFLSTRERLGELGYRQYEVSSFAREGEFESRHNRKYWEGAPYLGLGPAAHSSRGGKRWWNVAGNRRYIALLAGGNLPVGGEEVLDEGERILERLFLGLRTTRGVDLDAFRREFGADPRSSHAALLGSLARDGLVELEGAALRPTAGGLAVADGLAARLASR